MNFDTYILQHSTRFFPHWNINCGSQVTGLIQLITYILEENPYAKTWCEIGSNIGESALIISSFPNIEKLYCVDFFWDGEKQYNKFCNKISINKHKIELIKKRSQDIYHSFPVNTVDVIYIDGDHSYETVKNDLEFGYNIVSSGGFICGHDYTKGHAGVLKAVNEFVNTKNLEISKQFLDSSFAIRKNYD